MSVFSGPYKNRDGLVFAYDAANTLKSNIGKPVSNLLQPANNSQNIYHPSRRPSTQNPPSGIAHGSYAVSTEVPPPVSGATVYRVDDNAVDTQNVRWSIRLDASTFLTYDQPYTFSSWVYLPSQYAGRYTGSTIEIYQNTNGNDWHSVRGFSTQFNYYGAGSIRDSFLFPDVSLLNTWQRIAVTFTPLAANVNLPENDGNDNNIWVAGYFRINVANAVSNGTPYHLYIADAQLESGNILSDFVLEERTKSQSFVDTTGTVPIVAENLEYTSNNKFKFNGTSSYLDIQSSIWTPIFSSSAGTDFTIETWIKPENIGTDQAIFGQRHGDALSLFLLANGKVTLEMDDTQTYAGTNTVLQNDQWYNVTVVFNQAGSSSTCDYYVNGKFERSENKADSNIDNWGNPTVCWIGWQSRDTYSRNPGYFNGEIDVVDVYSRALSANEIFNNFNNRRSRFGI
jgi:hypothetical protein